MVTVKPGDVIVHDGESLKVVDVSRHGESALSVADKMSWVCPPRTLCNSTRRGQLANVR